MKLRDLRISLLNFWNEFRKFKYGMVGLALFAVFVLVIVFEPFIIPFGDAGAKWRDVGYWEENPQNAVPIWMNTFSHNKYTVSTILKNPEMKTEDVSGIKVMDGVFTYNYKYAMPPIDMIFHIKAEGNVTVSMSLVRPDNQEIIIFNNKNIVTSTLTDTKISIAKESTYSAIEFARQFENQVDGMGLSSDVVKPLEVYFAKAQQGMSKSPVPLHGDYQFKINMVVMNGQAQDPQIFVSGSASGLLGTDNSKRDLWSGIICGTKWAMLIGLLTAIASVLIGVLIGVVSAYYGGWVDSSIMRIYEILSSIPLLPVLIVISAIFKPSIWTLIILMCLFNWVGPVRTVRSIGMQIKQETYIEAAHALDASNARIIFRHMIPQLLPYSFASIALAVPGGILAEASLSLIGLGDATIVTWGQILHDAMISGAVLQGLWWWVVPPGILIALLGMTFAFIGYAMDTILNPKLRTR